MATVHFNIQKQMYNKVESKTQGGIKKKTKKNPD